MAEKRRVAVVINMSVGFRHHFDVFAGIQRFANEHKNWEIDIQPFLKEVRKATDKKRSSGHHGVIARASAELERCAIKAGVPVVNVWSGSPAKKLPSVIPDFHACGRMAAEHLLSRGLRRFAFQGFSKNKGSDQLFSSFKAALKSANCDCTAHIFPPRYDLRASEWEKYRKHTLSWIKSWTPPIGVFSVQDMCTRYIADACRAADLRIPDDVALIGVGNELQTSTQLKPTLSSIDAGYDRVGYHAAGIQERLMNGKPAPVSTVVVAPTELVVRESTDVFMVGNPIVTKALRFIAEHSHKDINVRDVAKHVKVAIWSLRRYFDAELGRTIVQEIVRLRIERAKRLLVESDTQIKQLANQCGFNEVKHFYKVFVKSEGESPTRYRQTRARK